jgi:predicted RND superfamily exporter protein
MLTRACVRRPGVTVGLCLLLTVAACLVLPRLEVRTDGASIYPQRSSVVLESRQDRRTFHEPERVIVLVSARPGGMGLHSPEGLSFLQNLHEALDRHPAAVSGGVRSVADLLRPPEGPGSLHARRYLGEVLPGPGADHRALLRDLWEHPLTEGLFLSTQGRAAALYVPLDPGEDRQVRLAELETWLAERPAAPFDLRLTGPVVAETRLGEKVLRDLAWLVPIMVLVICGVLLLALDSVAGVVLAMIEVLFVLLWTLASMAATGVPVTLVTTILPTVLMSLAVTDEIHLLERVQHFLALEGGDRAAGRPALRARALLAATAEIQRPLVLTSLTTALAFLSFQAARIAPVRHFGLFTGLGIVLAMVFSFTLIPGLAMLLPVRWMRPWRRRPATPGAAVDDPVAGLLARHGGAALAAGLLVTILCASGAVGLSVQDSWIENFDPRSEIVAADRELNDLLWGSYRFDIVLESTEEGFFRSARGLSLMERLRSEVAEATGGEGGLVSHLVPFEIVAEGWREELPVSALPDRTLGRIAAWVRVLRDRIDLDQFVTEDGRSARARILVNSPDFRKGELLARRLNATLAPIVEPAGVRVRFSGDLPVAVEVVRSIVATELRSMAWTLAGIVAILLLTLRDPLKVLVILSPAVSATAAIFGLMGHLQVPLGIATSMFAAMTLGVGLDFALHVAHRYERAWNRTRDHRQSVLATLSSSGRAIRWNVWILASGFLVLTCSALKPNRSLGFLLAGALLACYAATLLYLPALLGSLARRADRVAGIDRQGASRQALEHVAERQLRPVTHDVRDGRTAAES